MQGRDGLGRFLECARDIAGRESVTVSPDDLQAASSNTLGLGGGPAAWVRADKHRKVKLLVREALRLRVPLYPVSRGRNLGYGDRLPPRQGCVLLDLSDMRRIWDYDKELGLVRIEPGVSQSDLHQWLTLHGAEHWMDTTGAGNEASIVGNTLEGGFGHTPLGNHREEFCDLRAVLGTGQTVRTGCFPGLGPDVRGLFVQSNFAVVTGMRIPLMPIPERYESFVVRAPDAAGLPGMVDALRGLRQACVVRSCVHIANPVRYLISSRPCPPGYEDRLIDDEEAARIMSTRLMPVGRWSAAGGLYGSRDAVAAHRRSVRKALEGVGSVEFFSREKVGFIKGVCSLAARLGMTRAANLLSSLESFERIQELMTGTPNDEAYRNILWRVRRPEDFGLIWFAPEVEAKGASAARIESLARPLFADHGFEMPLTLTLVTPFKLVGILNVTFNRNDIAQVTRAHALYTALDRVFTRAGIAVYRTSVLRMASGPLRLAAGNKVVRLIKRSLDPQAIIAPGRYGIG